MPLPLLVASPSPGMEYNHAQLVSGLDRSRDLVQPPLEKFSDIQREADEQRRLAVRLMAEKEQLLAENEILMQQNDELRSRQGDGAESPTAEQQKEVKRLKKQLKAAKASLAATAKLLEKSERTVAELRIDAAADAAEKQPAPVAAARKAAPKRRQAKAKPSAARRPGPRARSEPPRYEEDESGSESGYSDEEEDDRRNDRGYSSRGFGYSDEDDDSGSDGKFPRNLRPLVNSRPFSERPLCDCRVGV